MDEDLKKCSSFFKDITKKDSYRPSCNICCEKY